MNGALNRDDILQLFNELAGKLKNRGVRGHIYIVGGAAMIFGFRRERTTHDVDARIENDKEAVLAAAAEIAEAHDLRTDWLNENATLFMPHGKDPRPRPVFNTPDLVVTGASTEHLLAMKLEAARESDADDIRTLLHSLGIRSESDAIAIHDGIFPRTPLREHGLEILRTAIAARSTGQPSREGSTPETNDTVPENPPRPPAPAKGAADAAARNAEQRGPSRS